LFFFFSKISLCNIRCIFAFVRHPAKKAFADFDFDSHYLQPSIFALFAGPACFHSLNLAVKPNSLSKDFHAKNPLLCQMSDLATVPQMFAPVDF